jgi:DNA-binding transcriptional MerR regulator
MRSVMTAAPKPGSKVFFKIGDVSAITKLPAYVLRFWESEFSFLRPRKSSGQQRLYVQRDIEQILEIKRLLYEEGYTIAGVKRLWSRRGRRAHSASQPRAVTERLRGELRTILKIIDSYNNK